MESATTQSTIISIDQIKIGERFRKDMGNLIPLAQSIREIGLLHPVVVDANFNLIAGLRRIKAVQTLGWTRVPIHIVDLKDLMKGEFAENAERKQFTPSELVAIKRHFEPEIVAEAKERQGTRTDLGEHCAESARSRVIVASYGGVSHDTMRKAEDIVEAAEKDPEKFTPLLEKVDNGKISINAAHIQVNRANKHKDTPNLPEGEFDVIYADPPWKYDFCLEADPKEYYATMDTQKICDLQIPTAENAILFLWATNPKLEDALTVAKAWGFKYITNFVWVKQTLGPGYYSMAQHELLLLCKRGDIPPPQAENRPASVVHADRENHSEKPVVVYEIIEKMYPNRKYLELFSRNKQRNGWVMWGNQLGEN